VRAFLAQFLADPFVINYPRWLWLPLLYGIILRVRPRRSARLYERIWTPKGSPLLLGMESLAQKLEEALIDHYEAPVHVVAGMRYGEPSLAAGLRTLHQRGVDQIRVLPLFPQYSGTTTGTILAAVFKEVQSWPFLPNLCIIRDYHDHPAYLRALAENIRVHWQGDTRLLFSFHGIPRSYVDGGDPYERQCQRTAERAAQALHLKPNAWSISFQSRFGPQEWLSPYTDEELSRFGSDKLASLDVVCPGFAVDCLETLDEIGHEAKGIFQGAGGGVFNYIPALNDSPAHVEALKEIIISNYS
jgi:ferrochelatase